MTRVELTGNLTRNPELRATKSGKPVANLRLAVNRRDRDPVYIDVTAWNGLAETCGQYLAKGRHIAVSGRLDFEQWTSDDGAKRSRHYVVADEIDFLDRAGSDE